MARRKHPKPKPKPKPKKPPAPAPKPGAGGATTATTSSPTAEGGVTAAAGDLTGATTTAPVPQAESMDEIEAFFSSGTGAAQHYHQMPQQAEQPAVQQTGAGQ